MMFRKKEEIQGIKLKDIKDAQQYVSKNPDKNLRYAVVCGEDRLPIWLCQTRKEAEERCNSHFMVGGQLPVQIIDL